MTLVKEDRDLLWNFFDELKEGDLFIHHAPMEFLDPEAKIEWRVMEVAKLTAEDVGYFKFKSRLTLHMYFMGVFLGPKAVYLNKEGAHCVWKYHNA